MPLQFLFFFLLWMKDRFVLLFVVVVVFVVVFVCLCVCLFVFLDCGLSGIF